MAAHVDVSAHTLRMLYQELCTGRTVVAQPYSGAPTSPLLPPIEIPKPSSLMPVYTAIVLGAMLLGTAVAVGISLVRPTSDNATLISTVMTGLGVATLQALNFIKSSQAVAVASQTTAQVEVLHKSVNSGFEEFTRLIREEAYAAGIKESETKQSDLAAVEARITAAVTDAVKKVRDEEAIRVVATQATARETTKEVAQTMATDIIAKMESVDVATIQPGAVSDIAEAVRSEPDKDTPTVPPLPPAP